jgi:hypothetical protein
MPRKLVARNDTGNLMLYQNGNEWILEGNGQVIEHGEGDGFSDYIDRRYGSAMFNCDEQGNDIENHEE